MNRFLGTNFRVEELSIIYNSLGGSINREKTKEFIESGYDVNSIQE